ncbi:MAG TPA: ABC transporter substrate-binding protein [Thermosynechococcaceae cyanobacterium]
MVKTLKGWVLAGLALVATIALASCNPRDYRTEATQAPQLLNSILSDPKTFNYALSNESPNVFTLTSEGLISENPLTSAIDPALAESWEISPDKKRIVFTLREGLKWSDGQPLTADDVVFSYRDIYLNPNIPTDIQDVLKIGKDKKLPGVKKLSDRKIEFTTPEPFAPFLRNTGGLAILPAHVLQETVDTKGSDGNPLFFSTWGTGTNPKEIVSNGPYVIESYTSSQRIVFRRNPYYWKKDAQGQPLPKIDRVIWKVVENQNTNMLKFRSGDLDIIEPIRPEDYSLLKQEAKRGKFTMYVGGPRPITTFMAFNQSQGKRNGRSLVDPIKSRWFNSLAFRQAVAFAIDREKMNNNIFRGLGELVYSTVIPQSPYYLSPQQGLKAYLYDLKRSKELLLGAGFKYDGQGQLLDSDGNRVRFTLMTNAGNTVREAMISQIKQDLAKIGIQVDLNPSNWNSMLDKLDNTLDWDACLMAFGGGLEPYSGINVWSTEGSSHNFNQPQLPGKPPIEGRVVQDWEAEISRLYTESAQELDDNKRKVLYHQIQKTAAENVPWITLVNARLMAVGRDRIDTIQYPKLGEALWNIADLKVRD